MIIEQLQPCPWCLGPVKFHENDVCTGCHNIWCPSCKALVTFDEDLVFAGDNLDDLRAYMAQRWNRRPYTLNPFLTVAAQPNPAPHAAVGVAGFAGVVDAKSGVFTGDGGGFTDIGGRKGELVLGGGGGGGVHTTVDAIENPLFQLTHVDGIQKLGMFRPTLEQPAAGVLRDCPMCGHLAGFVIGQPRATPDNYRCSVKCSNSSCAISTPEHYRDRDDAAYAWNRRPGDPAKRMV